MSRRGKNNHYHYAEKFEAQAHKNARDAMRIPKKPIIFTLLILLAFGLISTTFAAYVTDDSVNPDGVISVRLRNTLSERRGANYVDEFAKADDDLADSGVEEDLAESAATTYYYRGAKNNWGATAMTASSDGFYAYYSASAGAHQFKIATSTGGWDYNYTYVSAGFNGTNVSDIGDYSKDNCYCWYSNAHYIIIYYPSTKVNSSSSPKICASTTLPNNSMNVKLGEFFTNSGSTTEHNMTNSSGTWTYTQSLNGNVTRGFYFHVYWDGISGSDEYYKDQNEATMTYDHCTNWTFEQNNKGNPKLATVITGNYTFSFTYSSKSVSVTYPSYVVSTVKNISGAASSNPTPTSQTVAIGSSVTLTAPAAATGYEWVNWTITNGSATTGSYGGSAFSSSTTRTNLVVYPAGTDSQVTFTANYKVQEYNITYKPGSATGVSGTQFVEKKQYNVPYTILDKMDENDELYFSRPGYTQVGWSTSQNATSVPSAYAFGASYTTNQNLTLYPVWSIDAPTVSISNVTSYVAGSTAISLTNTVTSDASGITPTKSFVLDPSATQPSGGDANPNYGGTPGSFYATVPGIYTVKLTGTVSNAATTNGSASASDTCTVTVVPAQPTFTVTLSGWSGEGDGTPEDPYKIIIGSTYGFSAAVDSPIAGMTYSWSMTGADGTWNSFTGAAAPYANASITTDTATNDHISFDTVYANQSTEQMTFALYLKVERNGQSATAIAYIKKYFVQPLIERFEFQPLHKIYDELDESVSVLAEYNLADPTGYTTTMYFSKDMNQYIPIQTVTGTFIQSFDTTLRNYLYPAGVKYFKMQITKGNLTSTSTTLHTTVGTKNFDATRPFYFVYNISGSDLVNKRVMAFWDDPSTASGYSYQTAQDVNLGIQGKAQGVRFRVNLPTDAENVIFAVVGKDSDNLDYYGMPTYSSGTYSFSTPYFTAISQSFTPSDLDMTYTATAKSGSGVENMTGSLSGFVPG